MTQSGRPKIVKQQNDGYTYLILSSSGGYTRRGCGYVTVLKDNTYKVISKGNGADGDAGRIGTWDVRLIEVPVSSTPIFRIRMSGGNPSKLCTLINGTWMILSLSDYLHLVDVYDLVVPFKFNIDDLKFNADDWIQI
jgi:hypothetical protein